MELKPYQQQVIDDLALYLEKVQETKDISNAFHDFWVNHPRTPLIPSIMQIIEPYKNNIKRVPHICMKVPTAGGKTFTACNALKTIFDAFDHSKSHTVVWLVPSITILEQTIRNLSDPTHPYRQRINTHFGNRVEVYDKIALLTGSNFNTTTVKENLNILVLSFDSLRAKKKEDRKVFQENGNLLSFGADLNDNEEITLMNIIRSLNPVVVVDESHNAETELSVEMLQNLNPCFILDLTATPRKNSNIISFVDALELKKEDMVKLPVIVYNHREKTEVIASAIQLQRKLEFLAKEQEADGGKYIRPIVLFQAQPKSNKDNTTFEKIKEILIKSGIPEEQIKIKTANINEIKGIDLMTKECEVRYIITINALKEGWDCPFAYILASLADKSSAVDVEQILGRILRQPYATRHKQELLNLSFVLTASAKFMDTLENIVKGLNRAGFSSRDYRLAENIVENAKEEPKKPEELLNLFAQHQTEGESVDSATDFSDIDINIISQTVQNEDKQGNETSILRNIEEEALKQSSDYENLVKEMGKKTTVPADLDSMVNNYPIKEVFLEQAKEIKIPQFLKEESPEGGESQKTLSIFPLEGQLFEKESLLEGFVLRNSDVNIEFDKVKSDLYSVDLDTSKRDNTPSCVKLDGREREALVGYILDPAREKFLAKNIIAVVKKNLGSMSPIADQEIDAYLNRVFENFTTEKYHSFFENEYGFSLKIKQKINQLSNEFAFKKFKNLIDTDKIDLKPSYALPVSISPSQTIDGLPKSLYEKEGSMNNFEKEVISEVANLKNIAFWTRNTERIGFRINGFINHYPDFIILTKNNNIVLLETKGDHLDAENKIEMGSIWQSKAGNGYKYFLVYKDREVKGAYKQEQFLDILKEL